ncbi:putative damage-inducible protein DinB [Tenacibaculum adriaticum]|uniref:Putative damage-inducible protein DinB n=1 Tax=Tenacibaculum adriaticum TaxID=413713 RepID=A0A5S5DU00_9FLAO|nr:DinB family protein [Tenacibaculum adriaticum]TYP99430.1 putative damage-inducible protein DinB [Tenacibaculum adriaticum]
MNSIEIIVLNFSEIRRRNIKLWEAIPSKYLNWQPDKDAFSIIEMIRHVLEGEHLYHKIIENKGDLGNYKSPWKQLEYTDLKNELKQSEKYRAQFLEMVKSLKQSDLESTTIERKEINQSRKLGDYLNRIAYHEAVHTGQMLSYLRTLRIEIPKIWD